MMKSDKHRGRGSSKHKNMNVMNQEMQSSPMMSGQSKNDLQTGLLTDRL